MKKKIFKKKFLKCLDCEQLVEIGSNVHKIVCQNCRKLREIPKDIIGVENIDYVVCQICKYKYLQIDFHHLLEKHNITFDQYKEMFPNTKLKVQKIIDSRINKLIGKEKEDFCIKCNRVVNIKMAANFGRTICNKCRSKENVNRNFSRSKKKDNYVMCFVCNKYLKRITNTHLKQHGLSFEQYKILYPESVMTSKDVWEKTTSNKKYKDTSIELLIQKSVEDRNIRYEKNATLVGRPDLLLLNKICIFCDGDYYHCNPVKYSKDYFNEKVGKYAYKIWEYDSLVAKILVNKGYVVLRFWECDINNNLEKCVKIIIDSVNRVTK